MPSSSATSKAIFWRTSKINASPEKVNQLKELLSTGTKELEFLGVKKSVKSLKDSFLQESGLAQVGEAREITVEALASTRAKNLVMSSLNFMEEGLDINILGGSTAKQQFDKFDEIINTRIRHVQNRFGVFGDVDEANRGAELKLLKGTLEELKKLRM